MSAILFRSRDDRFYRYIGVSCTFGLLDCDRYIGDIVIPWIVQPGFCSIHYTVTLAGLKNVNRYIGNIVLSKIVFSGFHCIKPHKWFLILGLWRRGGLVVSALDFRSRGRWFEPGHCRRVVSQDKKLYSTLSLFTQVYKWVPAIIMLGGNLAMD